MHYINPNEDEIRIDQSDLIKKRREKFLNVLIPKANQLYINFTFCFSEMKCRQFEFYHLIVQYQEANEELNIIQ